MNGLLWRAVAILGVLLAVMACGDDDDDDPDGRGGGGVAAAGSGGGGGDGGEGDGGEGGTACVSPSDDSPRCMSCSAAAQIECSTGEGPCVTEYLTWVACVEDAGCIGDGQTVDRGCSESECPDETAAFDECLNGCEPWLACYPVAG